MKTDKEEKIDFILACCDIKPNIIKCDIKPNITKEEFITYLDVEVNAIYDRVWEEINKLEQEYNFKIGE